MTKAPGSLLGNAPTTRFLTVAQDLEVAGLLWHPEVGDEVADRAGVQPIAILVDPQGMTPKELRSTYLWLPTVEQMIFQFEARQAVLFHAGFEVHEKDACYKTVIQARFGHIESKAHSFRASLGLALRDLLLAPSTSVMN
jgi:DNA-binding PucR family transcriptional regulator